MTIPVTLVTGFLGAGKTTLINRLLVNEAGLTIAAIVNDFGSINIDAALIAENSDDVIGLKNGCICCSLQGDLLRTLKSVLTGPRAVDRIVIEASGVSDPQGIIEVLMDPVVRLEVSLDAIVTVIDVEALLDNPQLENDVLWQAQLRAGDFVALSKGTAEQQAALAETMQALGKAFVFDSATPPALALLGAPERSSPRPTGTPVVTDQRFVTLEWEWEGSVATIAFQTCIEALAPLLVRAKGILNLSRSADVSYSFNLVGRRASMDALQHRQDKCQLVLIGERGVFDPEAARALLFKTFADLKVMN